MSVYCIPCLYSVYYDCILYNVYCITCLSAPPATLVSCLYIIQNANQTLKLYNIKVHAWRNRRYATKNEHIDNDNANVEHVK